MSDPGRKAGEVRRLVLDADCAGERLDRALAARLQPLSRSLVTRLIRDGRVLVDGRPGSPKNRVCGGETVVVELPVVETDAAPAEDIPLAVVFADAELVVIDKPAGLVVHPGAGNRTGTLMNALLHLDRDLAALPRAGIVHRLDKDTSGLMVVARTEACRQRLIEGLASRSVTRAYRAVVHGEVITGGTIDAPVGRHAGNRLKMAVRRDGKPAVTRYRVRRRFSGATELDVNLETGRTHQIRVHLSREGFPLIGDPLYGGRPRLAPGMSERARQAVASFPRQALHAAGLSFTHPRTGETLRFAAEPPSDYRRLVEALAGSGDD